MRASHSRAGLVQGGPDGALGGVRSSKLLDGFQGGSAALFLDELGDSAGIEVIGRGGQFARNEGIVGPVVPGEVEQIGDGISCAVQFGRGAEGLQATVGIDGVAPGVGGLGGGVGLRDVPGLGLIFDCGVGHLALLGLLGLHLLEGLGGLEIGLGGVGGVLCELLVGDLLLLKGGVFRFGQEGLGEGGQDGEFLGGLRLLLFQFRLVELGGPDVGHEGGSGSPGNDGDDLGILTRFENGDLEVALEFLGHHEILGFRDLGLLRFTLEGQLLFHEGLDTDGDDR